MSRRLLTPSRRRAFSLHRRVSSLTIDARIRGGTLVQLHPIIELSNDRQVRHAKGFKEAAADLSGERIASLYETELANAPKRAAAGKKYLVKAKPPTSRRPNKDEEHLSLALLRHCRDSGQSLDLPGLGSLDLLAAQVPLATASVDRSLGDADPNKGVRRIDTSPSRWLSRTSALSARLKSSRRGRPSSRFQAVTVG